MTPIHDGVMTSKCVSVARKSSRVLKEEWEVGKKAPSTPKANRKDKRLQRGILETVYLFIYFIKFKFYSHPLRKPQTSGESIMSAKI